MPWCTEKSLMLSFLGNLSEKTYFHIFSLENILIIFLKNMVNIMIVEVSKNNVKINVKNLLRISVVRLKIICQLNSGSLYTICLV